MFVIEKYFQYGNAPIVWEEWINEYGDERSPPHGDTIYHLEIDFIKMEPWPIYHDQAGHVVLELQKWQIMCPLLLHKAHKKALFD